MGEILKTPGEMGYLIVDNGRGLFLVEYQEDSGQLLLGRQLCATMHN